MSLKECSNKLTDWNNILKMVLAIIGLILTVIITPIAGNIKQSEQRIADIEHVKLPRVFEEQSRIRSEIMEIRVRQEAQLETLKKIADDVEYLRRKSEARKE